MGVGIFRFRVCERGKVDFCCGLSFGFVGVSTA